jgi:Sec-independent protein translocase protein TatA
MRLGITELIVIILIATILLKPEKLKDYMLTFHRAKKTYEEAKEQVVAETKEIVEPIKELNNDVNLAMKGEL